jgi:hypothetical protein
MPFYNGSFSSCAVDALFDGGQREGRDMDGQASDVSAVVFGGLIFCFTLSGRLR